MLLMCCDGMNGNWPKDLYLFWVLCASCIYPHGGRVERVQLTSGFRELGVPSGVPTKNTLFVFSVAVGAP